MNVTVRFLARLAVVLLIAATLLRAQAVWRTDHNLDHVAGAWTGLALDLENGIFYRPILGADGYGGTRFFPLQFSAHATLIALGGDPRVAGYALSVLWTVLLLSAVHVLARRLGATGGVAVLAAAAVLAAESAQYALTTIRGDLLPAALNVWGVAALAAGDPGGKRDVRAAALFTLAFAAKVTTVFGAAAVVLHFLLTGRFRRGARLALLTGAGYLLVLGTMVLASGGRVIEILSACASAGATPGTVVKSPWNVLFLYVNLDPSGLPFALLGAAAFLSLRRGERTGIAPLFYLATVAVTLLIFGSPGTYTNHLLDLHVASLVLTAAWIGPARSERAAFPVAALAVAILLSLRTILTGFPYAEMRDRGEEFRQVLGIVGEAEGPILSENPYLPVLAGRRPYVLDSFMLRLIRERDPSFGDALWQALSERRFAAVVLENDPGTDYGRYFLAARHFGEGFLEKVEENYASLGKIGGLTVYLPKGGQGGAKVADAPRDLPRGGPETEAP